MVRWPDSRHTALSLIAFFQYFVSLECTVTFTLGSMLSPLVFFFGKKLLQPNRGQKWTLGKWHVYDSAWAQVRRRAQWCKIKTLLVRMFFHFCSFNFYEHYVATVRRHGTRMSHMLALERICFGIFSIFLCFRCCTEQWLPFSFVPFCSSFRSRSLYLRSFRLPFCRHHLGIHEYFFFLHSSHI